MSKFSLNDVALMRLKQYIQDYGDYADRVITDYLDQQGGTEIMENISLLIPASGRNWPARNFAPARDSAVIRPAKVFRKDANGLVVLVASKRPYNYLYFPDDGSTTLNHYGNKQFMLRGAEAASEEVIDGIIKRLIERK